MPTITISITNDELERLDQALKSHMQDVVQGHGETTIIDLVAARVWDKRKWPRGPSPYEPIGFGKGRE
jgi:hypothetical protein